MSYAKDPFIHLNYVKMSDPYMYINFCFYENFCFCINNCFKEKLKFYSQVHWRGYSHQDLNMSSKSSRATKHLKQRGLHSIEKNALKLSQ